MASWDFSFYLLCPPSLCSFHDIMLSACVGLVLFPGDIWILSPFGMRFARRKKILACCSSGKWKDSNWCLQNRVPLQAYEVHLWSKQSYCRTVLSTQDQMPGCWFLLLENGGCLFFFFSPGFQIVQFSDFHTLEATPLESPWKHCTHTQRHKINMFLDFWLTMRWYPVIYFGKASWWRQGITTAKGWVSGARSHWLIPQYEALAS